MLARLNSYLEARQGRAGRIVAALVVVIILMSAALLYQWLDVGDMFDPPYPSEVTPLSLDGNEVMWEYQGISWFSGYTLNWTNMSVWWGGFHDEDSGWAYHATPESFLTYGGENLSQGVEATVVIPAGLYDQTIHTDVTGNGVFDSGDYIVFEYGSETVPEDNVFTVALACHLHPEWSEEFSFAVADGDFYSWRSSSLNTDDPWWEFP